MINNVLPVDVEVKNFLKYEKFKTFSTLCRMSFGAACHKAVCVYELLEFMDLSGFIPPPKVTQRKAVLLFKIVTTKIHIF